MTQRAITVSNLHEAPRQEPTYVALGSFDGVHLGHQALLQEMVTEARRDGVRTAVVTFFPHPKRFIQGQAGRYYLISLADRVTLLAAQGIDLVITHPFDDTLRYTRAEDFVDQLRSALDMRQLWGGNITFGYRREGDLRFLQQIAPAKGFSVHPFPGLVAYEGRMVSSSRIRQALKAGDISEVNGCLGRDHSLSGTVVMGDQRGRTIGFPTANLAVWDELLLPADGVYATATWVGEKRYLAATNVGVRPTVNGRARTVEAHLLDFDDDLYGQTLRVAFLERIRPEKRFANVQALQDQIQADVAQVRERQDGAA